MTFKESQIETFLKLFKQYKDQIRNQPGCKRLELIQNPIIPAQISTLSKWETESDLNNYRESKLFGIVWPETKKLFAKKPEAQSFEILTSVY